MTNPALARNHTDAEGAQDCMDLMRIGRDHILQGELEKGLDLALGLLRCAARCKCARHLVCSHEARALLAEVSAKHRP